jgi:archaellum component FlaC
MSTVTDNDLKELKDLINSKFEQVDRNFEKIDSKFEKVFEEFTAVKVEIATIKSDVNGLGKRLDNLEFIARSVIGGILVALLLGLTKILYPNLLG